MRSASTPRQRACLWITGLCLICWLAAFAHAQGLGGGTPPASKSAWRKYSGLQHGNP